MEFVASRVGAKYVIRDYTSEPQTWLIDEVPENIGFNEEITTQILGSRRPVLFIEGDRSSFDLAIYRNCYPEWMIIPMSSCEGVIHSVITMKNNQFLTRIACSGIVDLDGRSQEDINYLNQFGIMVLPVCEIENLFLLPEIISAIGKHEGYDENTLSGKMQEITDAVIEHITLTEISEKE